MTPWLLRHNSGALDGVLESYVTSIADTGDGYVVAAGYDFTHVTKVDYEGNVQWQFTDVNTHAAVVGADTSGNVFVLDYARLTKISSAGTIQWQKSTSTGFIAQPSLTVLADGSCLVVSGNTDPVLRIAKFSSAGLLTFEKTYTGATDEVVNGTKGVLEGTAGDLYHFTHDNTGDAYVKLTKLSSALAITWSKSYSTAALSFSVKASCRLADGGLVVGFLDAASGGTLRLAKIAEDGTVTWSKSVADSNVANFLSNGFRLYQGASGFFVQTRATAGPLTYKFDTAGALEWARVIAHPTAAGGWIGEGVIENADGILLAATPFDTDSNAVPSFFKLRADGTSLGDFASNTVEITNWTTVSVAAGATLTVATDSNAVVASTAGTVTTNAAEVTTSNYPLLRYYHDLLQVKQAAGSRLTRYGTPNSPYSQAGTASGWYLPNFGTASAFILPATGTQIGIASGSKVLKTGSPVDNSSTATVATGTLVTKFGTGTGLTSNAATGAFNTKFGTAKGVFVTYATGSKLTKYGTPTALTIGVASGTYVTKFGTAATDWGVTGTVTGTRGTHFGTPTSLSIFHAIGSRKTRYGTAKLVRGTTC